MSIGALAWVVGNALWLTGSPVYRIILWWAGFLVLTIAGELNHKSPDHQDDVCQIYEKYQ